MDMYLSGAACRAVFVDGITMHYVNLDRPTEKIPFGDKNLSIAAISRLLGDSPDIRNVSVGDVEEGLQLLLSDSNKDSALRLFEVAMDFQKDAYLAVDAMEVLEPILQDEEVVCFLRNYAFAVPIDLPGAQTRPPDSWNQFRVGFNLLLLVLSAQPYIRAIRVAWDNVARVHFPTQSLRMHGEKTFVDCGAFFSIYETMMGERRRDNLTIELLMAATGVYGYRDITKAWCDALNLERERSEPRLDFHIQSGLEADEKTYSHEANTNTFFRTDREKFERVRGEQSSIIDRLQKSDLRNAERFTERVISRQLDEGDADFAAKTLCLLSQEAKRLGETSLQLKWAVRATEVYNDDPWSFAQTGDALVALFRYDEASEYYALAGTKGDPHYARMGRARLLMLSGQSEDALREFEEIISLYPNHENTFQAWRGMADTLRHTGELDRALQKYEQTILKYPQLDEAYSGKAMVLRELGRLDEAVAIYTQFKESGSGAIWAFAGAGEVLRDAGDFDGALALYEEASVRFPGAEAMALGRAQVLRAAGRLEDALGEFQQAKDRSHEGPRIYGGMAQTLRDIGRLDEALGMYEDAIERFPAADFLLNGRASVINRLGLLEEALAAYDENCRMFPYNLPALLGRVQLLKEFERTDLAFDAARDVVTRFPSDLRAKAAMAAILALQGKFEQAKDMLPTQKPRTRSEWVAHHVGCMVELRRGNLETALGELRYGVEAVPFYRTRRYYQNALAAAELRSGRYLEALDAASEGVGAAADVMVMQAAASVGNRARAVASFNRLMSDPHENVVYLAEQIGRRLDLVSRTPERDEEWIANRNTEIVLALAA